MEKEYLGLGVVFNAVDQGFKKSVEGIKGALESAGTAMSKVGKLAGEGSGKSMFGGLTEGFKLLSLSHIGNTLDDIKGGITGTGHGINDTAKELDFMRAKMTAALDPKTASQFTSQMMDVAHASGLTGAETDTIAHNLLNSGVAAKNMGDSLPIIGTLVGKLGMDAGQVSTMFGQLQGYIHMSGKDAGHLTKEIFKLQKEYNLTNLMESLPEIVNNVYENMVKIGKTSPAMAGAMVQDVGRMAAAFQKMGMSQQKATQTATSFNDKMNDVRNAFLDLQAGLEPDSPIIQNIYDAFGSGGLNATDLINSIKSGKKTNVEIMQQMQDMVAKLPEQQRLNVTRRLQRDMGMDIANVIGPLSDQFKKVNDEADKQAKTAGSSEDVFKGLTHQLDSTLTVSEKLKNSAKEYVDVLATFMSKGNILQGLTAQTDAYNKQATQVTDLSNAWGEAYRMLTAYNAAGLAAIVPKGFAGDVASVGVWAEMLGHLVYPITSLLGIFSIIKGPLSFFGNFFKSGKGELSLFGKALNILKSPIKFLAEGLFKLGGFFENVGGMFARFASPLLEMATGLAEFGPVIAEVLTGPVGWIIGAVTLLITFWDQLTNVVSYFSKDAGDSMRHFGEVVGKIWQSIKDGAAYVFGAAWDIAKTAFGGILTAVSFAFKGMWGVATWAFGGILKVASWALGGIGDLFGVLTQIAGAVFGGLSRLFGGLSDYFGDLSQTAGPVLSDIFSLVSWVFGGLSKGYGDLSHISDNFFGTLGKVASEAFGAVVDAAKWMFTTVVNYYKFLGKVAKVAWDVMSWAAGGAAKLAMKVWAPVGVWFSAFWNGIKNTISGVMTWFGAAWTNVLNSFMGIWNGAKGMVSSAFDGVQSVVSNFLDWLSSMWVTVKTSMVNGLTPALDFFKTLGGQIYQVFKPIFGPITTMFQTFTQGAGSILSSVWDGFLAKFNLVKGSIMAGLKSITDMVPDFIKTDVSSAFSAFKNIFHHEPAKDAGATMADASKKVAPIPATNAGVTMVGMAPPVTATSGGTAPVTAADLSPGVSVPIRAQEGAPAGAAMAGVDLTPTAVPKLKDSDIQAMVTMLAQTKDAIVKAIVATGGKPVTVTLQGDARKFLNVMKQDANNRAGTAGLNSAVGG